MRGATEVLTVLAAMPTYGDASGLWDPATNVSRSARRTRYLRPGRVPLPGRLALSAPDWIQALTVSGMTFREWATWDKNNCDDKGPPLPPLAREYAKEKPVPGGPLQPTPVPVSPPSALTPEAIAKAVGVSTTVVIVVLVVSRIIRLLPPLWPTQASPI